MKINLYDFAAKSPTCTNSNDTNYHQFIPLPQAPFYADTNFPIKTVQLGEILYGGALLF